MSRLFGTDGVRGIANGSLTIELAMNIGKAGAYVLTKSCTHSPVILIGTDTRKSKDMLKTAVMSGICSVGGDVIDVGIIPTPALPFLVRKYKADAAVVITASHNPMKYNGIKWFGSTGCKLPNEIEDEIESTINSGVYNDLPTGSGIGSIRHEGEQASESYTEFLCSTCNYDLSDMHIAIDCANGSSYAIAPEVFKRLGAKVTVCANEPDGANINEGCGSTHLDNLQSLVKSSGADIGFAFDGDADRVLAVDENGNAIDGDVIMGINAMHLKEQGKLKNDTLVVTVMSNLGLKLKMKECGINIEETAVGDKHVIAKMLECGYNLGGEQSGHIIFLDYNTSGDGILSAIQTINTLKSSKKSLGEMAKSIKILPQVLKNVEVDAGKLHEASEDEELWQSVRKAEKELGEKGRVLVRASGTEPLIRIMLEGEDIAQIERMAYDMASTLKKYDGRIIGEN